LKLKLFILITLVYFAELLTDFSYLHCRSKLCRCIGQTPCSLEHYLVSTRFGELSDDSDDEIENLAGCLSV